MQYFIKILLAITILLLSNSCEKTYDDGPRLTFKSPMKRILGVWELVEMEGIEQINPSIKQYLEFTDEMTSSGFIFHATDFQQRRCSPPDHMGDEGLFSGFGYWEFKDLEYIQNCIVIEKLKNDEGLIFNFASVGKGYYGGRWKILKLTNRKLVIESEYCYDSSNSCEQYKTTRILTYKKV